MKFNLLNQMKAKSLDAGKHNDGRGLYLVKNNKNTGKWILRVSIHKKRREMGLGRWPDVTLANARVAADKARTIAREGGDPIADRAQQLRSERGTTVEEAILSCFEARKAELKGDGKPGQRMSPLMNHFIPKIGSTPIEQLDQHMLKQTLEPIWHSKPEVARKAINRTRLTLDHALALGLKVDIAATINAKKLLGKQRRKVKHIPWMPYEDVPAYYNALAE